MSPRPTGTVRRTPRGADLTITRRFRGSIDDVWQSVTASESTARWIGAWQGEPGPGKTVRFCMGFEEGTPWCDLKIEVCEAPHRLSVSMKDDYGDWRLELSLESQGEITELTFVQRLTDPSLAGDVGPGWEYYLDRLVAARESQPMPAFSSYHPAQKEHYLDQARAEGLVRRRPGAGRRG
ncbi:MAG TPA: SRPBCC family protein [Polyangiaceae bacterium]|nr:SRPBCC family protein [Polyangiaceae bacterium]